MSLGCVLLTKLANFTDKVLKICTTTKHDNQYDYDIYSLLKLPLDL